MQVLCRFNRLNQIVDVTTVNRLKKNINLSGDDEIGVEIGQKYLVYGIIFWNDAPWFYLCEDEEDDYPTPFPADLFDIIDDSIPDEWHLSYHCIKGIPKSELVFSEWANDLLFYENLINGSKKEVNIFKNYKIKLAAAQNCI